MLNVALKMLITPIVTQIAISEAFYPKPMTRQILYSTLIIGIIGPLLFQAFTWLLGFVGLLLGIVVLWILVSYTVDHYLNIRYDRSYALTQQIVIISLLLWLTVGIVIYLFGAKVSFYRSYSADPDWWALAEV